MYYFCGVLIHSYTTMLNIENLSFRYSKRRPLVVKDLSLSLKPGSICGLLGPNGTGKTTLLQLIMGALTPQKGLITFDGNNTSKRNPHVLKDMILVPEEIALPAMSLSAFAKNYSTLYPSFSYEIFEKCIAEFGITDIGKLTALSMGQKKKAYLSFALACRPKLLLMDEPTNGLDIPGKAALRRLLAGAVDEDTTVIISTHQVRDIEQMLDHIIIINNTQCSLNAPTTNIQRALAFFQVSSLADIPQPLAYTPSPFGFYVMTQNTTPEAETPVNIELLFEYAMREPQILSNLINDCNDKL